MNQRQADGLLILVTVFWGSSYLFMKMGLSGMNAFHLIAWRFAIAFLLTGIIFSKKLFRSDWQTLRYGALLGALLLGVFSTLMWGIRTTSAAKAGFLVSLTIVFVPLISSVILRKKIGKMIACSLLLAIGGIFLLTFHGLTLTFSSGDSWCVAAAFFNACYIIAADRFTKRSDTITLGIWQLGFTAAFAAILMLIFEPSQWPEGESSWIAVLGLGILCSAVGYTLQSVAQGHTTSVHAGLIFALEPVFAAGFALLFAGENLSVSGWLGASLILLSVLVSEWHPNGGKTVRQVLLRQSRSIIQKH
ncbi:DMT family transporter [Sporolactobacillus spathodeae]|uniref:Drug/metabolite transporter (DMT)-like permease n=1 Tax=Sporolactobacillus spathodeae TaxID=1465502 RepID=A0ABS2Q8W2_9BACL|nr:DMT family transporter [Sporolactobacillus spathodeae]MBM7657885.1 drug/metabolite transporter (DMT)-like permease [Sporolactobacillus spathodeae]